MTRRPRIPMRPTELPQQRLYLVKGQPVRPAGWPATIGEPADNHTPATMPRSARYLGQVEWAWSPMHMRIDANYLSMDRPHGRWLLWAKPYDDNWGRWDAPLVLARAPRARVAIKDAATLLLIDYLASQRDDGTDRFHWVNEEGLLDSGDMNAIASTVWGDEIDGHADGAVA